MQTAAEQKVTCMDCNAECRRFGKHRNGLRRFRCPVCKRTYTEPHQKCLDNMIVPFEKALMALNLLIEGSSVRSTERITGLHRDTILRVLAKAGEKCANVMARYIVNVPVRNVECDEMWGFIQKKEGHKGPEEAHDNSIGDAYCFVAIDRDTKLVLNFALGRRDIPTTQIFVEGLRHATSNRHFQLTTDGFRPYRRAVEDTLGDRVDFAQLIKVYRQPQGNEGRYSPAEISSTEVVPVLGDPDPDFISTSIVERNNLTMRMQIRRLTRLTNGFSKKWENHWSALCLWFAYYNFCRIHSSIRVTPAIEAGITDHIWKLEELLATQD